MDHLSEYRLFDATGPGETVLSVGIVYVTDEFSFMGGIGIDPVLALFLGHYNLTF